MSHVPRRSSYNFSPNGGTSIGRRLFFNSAAKSARWVWVSVEKLRSEQMPSRAGFATLANRHSGPFFNANRQLFGVSFSRCAVHLLA
jgi:hypothetical protein